MIEVKTTSNDVVEVKVKGALQVDDFTQQMRVVDEVIKRDGHACLLIDATEFNGWENMDAAEKHFQFVKEHQQHIERLALVAGQTWQHWIGVLANVFVHPEVKVFEAGEKEIARAWLSK